MNPPKLGDERFAGFDYRGHSERQRSARIALGDLFEAFTTGIEIAAPRLERRIDQ